MDKYFLVQSEEYKDNAIRNLADMRAICSEICKYDIMHEDNSDTTIGGQLTRLENGFDNSNSQDMNSLMMQTYSHISDIREHLNEFAKFSHDSLQENVEEQNSNVANLLNDYYTFGIIILVSVIVVSFVLSRYISRLIIKLKEVTGKIAKGSLDAKIDIKSNDEIGELAESFMHMTSDLRKSRQKLEDYNKNLEIKVEKRTKKLEVANKRLKVLDKSKDEFISIAAHELKTPLTSIKSFAQIMQDKKIMRSEKKRKHYLDLINQNTERLYNLVIDLVDSSRIRLGKLKLDMTKIDLYPIFNEIKENMVPIIKEKGITTNFVIDKNIPKIFADSSRLLQILRNLLINATHYTEKGGKILLTIKRRNGIVQFDIEDTGAGIPKDKHAQIFKKYCQVDSSLTRKISGSGLGLSISKGLTEYMGGKMWFHSKVGEGTVFSFSLPINKRGATRQKSSQQ